MGNFVGRQEQDIENGDPRSAPTGLYFGDQFTMGGETFPSMNPEAFLFGDMTDLQMLSRMPGNMPELPPNVEHTNTIRCLVNLHKESLRLVRHAHKLDDAEQEDEDELENSYHIEFVFDSESACEISIQLFGNETIDRNGNIIIQPKSRGAPLFTRRFNAGMKQTYSFPEDILEDLEQYNEDDMVFLPDHAADLYFPISITIKALFESSNDSQQHAQVTFATFERTGDGTIYNIKSLAQKVNINGVSFLLREIYGIESSANDKDDDDDLENVDCVVCMSEAKDTMVLPCRHLCLCNDCAEVLRYQASKCPICRAPFHSLLRIRVAKPIDEHNTTDDDDDDDDEMDQQGAPDGFKLQAIAAAVAQQDESYINLGDQVHDGDDDFDDDDGDDNEAPPSSESHEYLEVQGSRTSMGTDGESAISTQSASSSSPPTTIQVMPSSVSDD